MVLTRIFRPSFAAASKGTLGFSMSASGARSCVGTLKWCSCWAAAEAFIGLIRAAPDSGAAATGWSLLGSPPSGTVTRKAHVGQSNSFPAADESTESSWSQFGQLKMMSIGFLRCSHHQHKYLAGRCQKKLKLLRPRWIHIF